MNNKRLVKNIGVSMFMKPISMVLSLIYTPLALNFLGEEKYGAWAVILNIVSWINIFDIGIGNGLRNKLAESYAKEDFKSSKIYVSSAYFVTTVLSGLFCFIIIFVWKIFSLSDFFNLNVTGENVDISIIISVLFIGVNFVLSLSKTMLYAIQQPGIISAVGVIEQFLQIAIIFTFSKFLQQSLIAVAIMYGIVTAVGNFLISVLVMHKNSCLVPSVRKIEMSYLKDLMSLGIGFFVIQICSIILNTTDNLLISKLFGSEDVTPYSVVYKVFYMFVAVHGIIIMPMWSAYTEAIAKGDLNWIKSTMKKVNLITLLFSFVVIIAVFVFEPFTKIWLDKDLDFSLSLIIITACYMVAQMFANNYASFLCGAGHIKVSVVLSAVGAIFNIPLSVFFAKTMGMGLSGIILGSLCVMLISAIVLPIVTKKWFKRYSREDC